MKVSMPKPRKIAKRNAKRITGEVPARKGCITKSETDLIERFVANADQEKESPEQLDMRTQALGLVLRRSPEAIRDAIVKARESLQTRAVDYADLHYQAATIAAAAGDAGPAQWALERITAPGEKGKLERIVSPAKQEAVEQSNMPVVNIGIALGGMGLQAKMLPSDTPPDSTPDLPVIDVPVEKVLHRCPHCGIMGRKPRCSVCQVKSPQGQIELGLVFDFIKGNVAIIGSSLKNYDKASDIDVIVLGGEDFPTFVKGLGLKYNGWNRAGEHIRRATPLRIPGVSKPVQLCQNDKVLVADDHPFCIMLRDGTRLHEGEYYEKPEAHKKKSKGRGIHIR